MPELPEVALFQQYFESTALQKKVVDIQITEPRILLDSEQAIELKLLGKTFIGTERVGKQLFVKLDSGEFLTIHFGMTGRLKYFKQKETAPKYTKVLFVLDNDYSLAFICPRILGRIGVATGVEEFKKSKRLGEDALQLSQERFLELLQKRKGLIKPVLMNQKVMAGLGNWVVDDMLYQARIHPENSVSDLSEEELIQLYHIMQDILKTAIERKADYDHFPEHFLITHREVGAESPVYPGNIQRIVVGGRGTYICPEVQQKR